MWTWSNIVRKMDRSTMRAFNVSGQHPHECRYPLPPSVVWMWEIRDTVDSQIQQSIADVQD
jgi:hypothetical protein